ncbi:hypothetical protein [Niallia taxi]|uniref:hypothetical protein n=1 Tax=Niallia taxi TaxID=2499688 RepID=UPI00399C9635
MKTKFKKYLMVFIRRFLSIESDSTTLISNKGFVEWREMVRNPLITTATLDLLYHSRTYN